MSHSFKSGPAMLNKTPVKAHPKGIKMVKASRKSVKTIINKEKPVREIRYSLGGGLSSTTLAQSFIFVQLNNIAQGNQINQRIGDKVYINGVKINLSMLNNRIQSRCVRMMIVRENNTRGGLLDTTNWTNLYEGSNFATRTADALSGDINSPINREMCDIIYDKTYKTMTNDSAAGVSSFRKWIPIRRETDYGTVAGGPTQPYNGRIYLIFHLCEPDNTTSGSTVLVDSFSRLFYKNSS